MLALTRKKGESLVINNNIEVTVLDIRGDQIKIGISAPKEVPIYRKEVYGRRYGLLDHGPGPGQYYQRPLSSCDRKQRKIQPGSLFRLGRPFHGHRQHIMQRNHHPVPGPRQRTAVLRDHRRRCLQTAWPFLVFYG